MRPTNKARSRTAPDNFLPSKMWGAIRAPMGAKQQSASTPQMASRNETLSSRETLRNRYTGSQKALLEVAPEAIALSLALPTYISGNKVLKLKSPETAPFCWSLEATELASFGKWDIFVS